MTTETQTLELPADVYDALLQAAREEGTSPAEWIAAHLVGPPERRWSADGLRAEINASIAQANRGEFLEGNAVAAHLHELAERIAAAKRQ